jgi:hypothetical protein
MARAIRVAPLELTAFDQGRQVLGPNRIFPPADSLGDF